MTDNWITMAVVVAVAAIVCWWYATRIARSYELYCNAVQAQTARSEAMEPLYRRSVELTEEGNRLKAEEIATLRELITSLRDRT